MAIDERYGATRESRREMGSERASSEVRPLIHFERELLSLAVQRSARAPFFARKLREAGLGPDGAADYPAWCQIPVTTKDELRQLSPREFQDAVVIAAREEIVDHFRSGGSTGKPLFYPRTAHDVWAFKEGYRRTLHQAGVSPVDHAHLSFPLGIHPLGRHYGEVLEEEKVATLWAGPGTSTSSHTQVELIFDLGATVWIGMPSYGLHLAQVAEEMGRPLKEAGVRRLITCTELMIPAKRDKLERLWGGEVYDVFGMTEILMMGVECENHDGFHAFIDLFFLEILDEHTLEPLPPGEYGLLVATPVYSNHATPFLRWVSGDIAAVGTRCGCRSRFARFPLLKLAGRTTGFFKIKGVNINHKDLEELLLRLPGVADYYAAARLDGDADALQLRVELYAGVQPAGAVTALMEAVGRTFGLQPRVEVVPTGTIVRQLASAVKQHRVVDERYGSGQASASGGEPG